MKKISGLLSIGIAAVMLAACSTQEESGTVNETAGQATAEELKIYTTVYPLQFFTEQIAGEYASVESIMPPGSDSHTYEPTMQEMVNLAEADAFIYNGAGLEPYAAEISESMQSEDVKTLEAAQGIDLEEHVHNHEEDGHAHSEEQGSGEHDHHGTQDPHVWLDPIRAIQLAENIKDLLVELKPEQQEVFEQNFEELKGQLEDLDDEFRTQIESLPGNKIIVSHAAYGYWEKAYGIEQIAVSGVSSVDEPSQKELQSIVEAAETYGLDYVFFEQNITSKLADLVRNEIGAEALRLDNLETLMEDDLAADENYFTVMERNLGQLTEALAVPSTVSEEDIEAAEEENGHDHDHNHDHGHNHDEETAKIHDGYFEDSQIEDRPLSDWEGDWQSVYPYLLDGTLDPVFAHKAEESDDMDAAAYKEYYEEGYRTDVERILIEEDTFTFFENGEERSGAYSYDAYEVLTYEAGNRGVRYVFKLEEGAEGMPEYIQFSDHSISPMDSSHYHLYWGDDREALLDEVTNWPTYYPSELEGNEIAEEMIAH